MKIPIFGYFFPPLNRFNQNFLYVPKCVDRDRNRFLYGVGLKFEFTALP